MTISNITPPFIPEDANAPFSKDQIAWLNGFLAGMYSNQGSIQGMDANITQTELKLITILWGSQTGNSEGLAKKASKALKGRGFAPSVVDMGEYDSLKLKDEDLLLIITSTYGDGEPPDNAAALYDWVLSEDAPRLEKLRYSVLAMGDSNYPDFCKCGIEFDERLKALGATQISPRVDCDSDFDDDFDAWLEVVADAAGAVESGVDEVAIKESGYGKKNPFPAKIIRNYNLNGETSSKETRHVEISIAGSGLSYEAGDALAVLPTNDVGYVEDLLKVVGFSGEEVLEGGTSLKKALIEEYDVTNLSLKTLKAYAALSGNAKLIALGEDKDAFKEFSWGRQFVDLLTEASYSFSSVEEFVGLLGKLSPRLYSISSSPNAHENEVHVTVGVVRYDAHGRERKGVCSNFLADHDGESAVRVFFHHSKTFKLPENDDLPVIMVGPGTGIAPFRAFLEERSISGAKGKNWLFFGDQHVDCDFLYSDELDAFQKIDVLTKLDTAFSRDQAEKVYVQNRMEQNGGELFAWLEEGGCFYVCGDASRMAKDVDMALHRLIAKHGAMGEGEAKEYVEGLKRDKRYLRDVY